MQLYKYKTIANDGFAQALDMVVNKRIYCSTSDTMNDPDEGSFSPIDDLQQIAITKGKVIDDVHRPLRELLDKVRFTCFSATATNPLLWAHYAGGYSGVCFQYEIPEQSSLYHLLPIKYGKIPPTVTYDTIDRVLKGSELPYVSGLLRAKRSEWCYENEYRLYLTTEGEKYLNGIVPTAVILGVRTGPYDSVFCDICRRYGMRIGYLNEREAESGYTLLFVDEIGSTSDV